MSRSATSGAPLALYDGSQQNRPIEGRFSYGRGFVAPDFLI